MGSAVVAGVLVAQPAGAEGLGRIGSFQTEGVRIFRGGMGAGDPGTPQSATNGRLAVMIDVGRASGSTEHLDGSAAGRIAEFAPIIVEAAMTTAVDASLLRAVIDVESRGNPRAQSPKGATGLMQLMPATGARHGATDLYDARQNIMAGARYLAALLKQFGSVPLALAAYNAGEGAVEKHGRQIPPYAETQAYVPKVLARYEFYGRTERDQNASPFLMVSSRS